MYWFQPEIEISMSFPKLIVPPYGQLNMAISIGALEAFLSYRILIKIIENFLVTDTASALRNNLLLFSIHAYLSCSLYGLLTIVWNV